MSVAGRMLPGRTGLRLTFGLVVGLAVALGLPEAAEGMGFDLGTPWWRWAALGIGPLWAAGQARLWQAPSAQRWAVLALYTLSWIGLVLALVQPERRSRRPRALRIVVLRDRSASVDPEAAPAAEIAPAALRRALGDQGVRPLTFGARGGEGSDLGRALERAALRLPQEAEPRILLLTDGGNTGEPLRPVVDRLRRAGIQIFQARLRSRLDSADVAVTGLEIPPRVLPDSRIRIRARIRVSSAAGVPIRCHLDLRGREVASATAEHGVASFDNLRITGSEPVPVAVRCGRADGATDAVSENDRYPSLVVPERRPRILVVDRDPRRARTLSEALGKGFNTEVRGPGGLPRTDASWRRWDAVIVSDLPRVQGWSRNNFTPRQMAQAEHFVREGGGLVMAGGPEALGPGGYVGTRLEQQILPVWLDVPRVRETPQIALAILLDRSGSMSGMKLRLAKEAAAVTAEALGRNDRIAVVVFDAQPEVVVRLQRAANRFRILDDINRISAGGGTHIGPALVEAFRLLRRTQARFRHVILLTDGQSPREGILQTVQSMTESGITVSTVAVGRQADRALLRDMAEAGGGRYHFTDSPRHIPKIFLRETRELRRNAAATERFRPRLTRRGQREPMLRGLSRNPPPLDGMVLVRPKRGARVLLTGSGAHPLLVTGRRGRGRVAVFTSDLKGIWSGSWLRSTFYPRFWRRVVRGVLPNEERDLPEVDLMDRGDRIVLRLRYPLDAKGAPPRPRVRVLASAPAATPAAGAEGARPVDVRLQAPGTWEAALKTSAPGTYLFEVNPRPEDPRAPTLRRVLARPYDRELAPATLLQGRAELQELAGEGVLPWATPETLLAPAERSDGLRTAYWPRALLVFALAWLLGLVLRRLPLGGRQPEGWLR